MTAEAALELIQLMREPAIEPEPCRHDPDDIEITGYSWYDEHDPLSTPDWIYCKCKCGHEFSEPF